MSKVHTWREGLELRGEIEESSAREDLLRLAQSWCEQQAPYLTAGVEENKDGDLRVVLTDPQGKYVKTRPLVWFRPFGHQTGSSIDSELILAERVGWDWDNLGANHLMRAQWMEVGESPISFREVVEALGKNTVRKQ